MSAIDISELSVFANEQAGRIVRQSYAVGLAHDVKQQWGEQVYTALMAYLSEDAMDVSVRQGAVSYQTDVVLGILLGLAHPEQFKKREKGLKVVLAAAEQLLGNLPDSFIQSCRVREQKLQEMNAALLKPSNSFHRSP